MQERKMVGMRLEKEKRARSYRTFQLKVSTGNLNGTGNQ